MLAYCERQGSLDSAIRNEQPNNIAAFLLKHPQVTHLAFNGGKALQSFQKQVQPTLAAPLPIMLALPSTSPAYAAMPFNKKLQLWQQISLN